MGTSAVMQAFLIFFLHFVFIYYYYCTRSFVYQLVSTVHAIMVYMYYMCIIVCEVVLLVLYCLLVSVDSVYLFTISPFIITCFCVPWLCSKSNATSQNICLELCQNTACCTCVPANTCTRVIVGQLLICTWLLWWILIYKHWRWCGTTDYMYSIAIYNSNNVILCTAVLYIICALPNKEVSVHSIIRLVFLLSKIDFQLIRWGSHWLNKILIILLQNFLSQKKTWIGAIFFL